MQKVDFTGYKETITALSCQHTPKNLFYKYLDEKGRLQDFCCIIKILRIIAHCLGFYKNDEVSRKLKDLIVRRLTPQAVELDLNAEALELAAHPFELIAEKITKTAIKDSTSPLHSKSRSDHPQPQTPFSPVASHSVPSVAAIITEATPTLPTRVESPPPLSPVASHLVPIVATVITEAAPTPSANVINITEVFLTAASRGRFEENEIKSLQEHKDHFDLLPIIREVTKTIENGDLLKVLLNTEFLPNRIELIQFVIAQMSESDFKGFITSYYTNDNIDQNLSLFVKCLSGDKLLWVIDHLQLLIKTIHSTCIVQVNQKRVIIASQLILTIIRNPALSDRLAPLFNSIAPIEIAFIARELGRLCEVHECVGILKSFENTRQYQALFFHFLEGVINLDHTEKVIAALIGLWNMDDKLKTNGIIIGGFNQIAFGTFDRVLHAFKQLLLAAKPVSDNSNEYRKFYGASNFLDVWLGELFQRLTVPKISQEECQIIIERHLWLFERSPMVLNHSASSLSLVGSMTFEEWRDHLKTKPKLTLLKASIPDIILDPLKNEIIEYWGLQMNTPLQPGAGS